MSKERIHELRAKAVHAREMADKLPDQKAVANLNSYAVDLEVEAAKLEAELHDIPPQAIPPMDSEPTTGPEAIAAMKPQADEKT